MESARLKRRQVISVSLTVVVLSLSFLTLASSLRSSVFPLSTPSDGGSRFVIPAPLILGAVFHDNLTHLNQPTRMEIYDFVKNHPGMQFRGICCSLNLPIGVVQYHLGLLTQAGLLTIFRDGRYTRYFESKRFSETEMTVISLLRRETTGKILSILLEKQSISHRDLSLQLNISSQALTWQMNRLRQTGLIESFREGMNVEYGLKGEDVVLVRRCIGLYLAQKF